MKKEFLNIFYTNFFRKIILTSYSSLYNPLKIALLLQDSAICRWTSFCDLPCRLSFPHSAFYPPFRRPIRIFGFRILLSAFRILEITGLDRQVAACLTDSVRSYNT